MKVLISAGHSNADPGAVVAGYTEAGIVTELRNIVVKKLKEKGVDVISDGEGSVNLPLKDAMKLQDQAVIDIELHCNASTNTQASGVESIGLPKDKALCQKLSKAIADVLITAVRGDAGYIDQTKSARGKLGYVSKGGIIVELFFLSNKTELDSYNAKKWLVAEAIANVVVDHIKNGKIS